MRRRERQASGASVSLRAADSACLAALVSALLFFLFRLPVFFRIGLSGQALLGLPLLLSFSAFLLSAFLLPPAIASLYRSYRQGSRRAEAGQLSGVMLLDALCLGILCALLFLLAGRALSSLSGRPGGAEALCWSGGLVILGAFLSVLRGLCLGRGNVRFYTVSLVLEQLLSGCIGLFLSVLFFRTGEKASVLYENSYWISVYGARSVVFSLLIGMLLTGILLAPSAFGFFDRRFPEEREKERFLGEARWGIRRQLEHAVYPLTGFVAVAAFAPFLDELIFGARAAQLYGADSGAGAVLGALSAARLCMLLFLTGCCGICAAVLPLLREKVQQRERRQLRLLTRLFEKSMLLYALWVCMLLCGLGGPLCALLFGQEEASLFCRLLYYGFPIAFFLICALSKCTVLLAMDDAADPLRNVLIAVLSHLVLLVLLLYACRLEAMAVLLSSLFGAAVFFGLTSASLRFRLRFRAVSWREAFLPIACAALPCAAEVLLYGALSALLPEAFLQNRLTAGMITLFFAGAASFCYGRLLLLSGAVRRKELYAMPLGRGIGRFLHAS